MPTHTSVIGEALPETSMTVDAGRLRVFAQATSQTDPFYVDLQAVRVAAAAWLTSVSPVTCLGRDSRDANRNMVGRRA